MSSELIIPEGGNYLRGEYVKEKGLTEIDLEPNSAKNVAFKRVENGVEKSETKVQVRIKYPGQKDGDPDTWTMNVTSARVLQKFFGSNNPADWKGKIPIEASKTTKGYAVFVDTMRLDKYKQSKL